MPNARHDGSPLVRAMDAPRIDEIEQRTGTLEWERLDQRRASRISFTRPNTSIETAATQADEMRGWLVQSVLKMRTVFGPLISQPI